MKPSKASTQSRLDTPTGRQIFAGMVEAMERAEPGWKARRDAEAIAGEARRQIELKRIVRHYGSEDAVSAETERERLLREALEPLADRVAYGVGQGTYIAGFAGWSVGNPPAEVWAALRAAYRFPETVADVWRELREWNQLGADRDTVCPGYDMPGHVRARLGALEHLLDTMPDHSAEGIRARLWWLARVADMDFSRDAKEDAALALRLQTDFDLFAQGAHNGRTREGRGKGAAVAAPRQTNEDKRVAVMALLRDAAALPDREIARRTGVSPQTVGNWRRKAGIAASF